MIRSSTHINIALSSVALVIVLLIQVSWILRTAKIKEELFNEKANMVLTRTAEALNEDKETCKNLQSGLGKNEVNKIDSLFRHYMELYHIRIEYTFEISTNPFPFTTISSPSIQDEANRQGSYQTCIGGDETAQSMDLKLVFPKKKEFILAEMGIPFMMSVLLILIVLVMSWRTMLSLLKEKKISEHTNDFLNNMTHEFKTPLTNIALAGKMMTKDSNIGQEDKIKYYSGIILEENEKLRLQVEHVLSMTALERGEMSLQKTALDFHQLIHDALKCISVQIENKQGQVQLQLEARQHVVLGDKTHLTNALCNLVDNAIKYSDEKPEIVIATFDRDQHLVVLVSDKGRGIGKEYQKMVFDKYFRVPTGDIHDVKGFGLGLAYTKRIFELHGGSIELQSEKGKGTTFTITLPYA